MPTFSALLSALQNVSGVVLKISVFYTRAPTKPRSVPSFPSRSIPSLNEAEKLKNYGYANTTYNKNPQLNNSDSDLNIELDSGAAYRVALADRVSVRAGRPPLSAMIETAARFAAQLQRSGETAAAHGVAVGACGPSGLVAGVAAAARKVPGDVRAACGGIEVHEE